MRTETGYNSDRVWAAVWLEGFLDAEFGGAERFDTVKLTIERRSGNAVAEILQDIGLPVLQPRRAAVSLGDRIRGLFLESLENPDDAVAAAEASAFAVLALRAGVGLQDSGEKQPVERIATGIAEFDEFFAMENTAEMASAGMRAGAVRLCERAANAGIELGILERSGTLISPTRQMTLESESNSSALAAAAQLASDHTEFGVALPNRFSEIDINAAARALRSIEIPTAVAVCYFGDTASARQDQRLQAAQAYPLLAERFAQDGIFRSAIDDSQPLAATVSQRFGLKHGHLKRIKKLTAPIPCQRLFEIGAIAAGADPMGVNRARRYSLGGEFSLDRFLRLMAGYTAEWVPDNDQGWCDLIDIMSSCALPLNAAFEVPVESVLKTSRGNWSGFKSALATAFGAQIEEFDRRHLALATSDAFELVDDFCRCVVLPQLLCTVVEVGEPLPSPLENDMFRARQISFRLIAGDSGNIAGRLYATARSWMSRIPALMAAENRTARGQGADTARYEESDSWPRLLENYTAENGLVVQNLCSESDLREESTRLSHCVGRLYLRKARDGNCQIFSVRSADLSASHSTIELTPPGRGSEAQVVANFRIVQHKGHANRRPGRDAAQACEEWIGALRSGQISANIDDVRNWRKRKREIYGVGSSQALRGAAAIEMEWSAALGRGWQEKDVRSAVWEEWRTHILKGGLSRARGPGFLFTKPEIRELFTSISPRAAQALAARARQE